MKIQGTGSSTEVGRSAKIRKKESLSGSFSVSESTGGVENIQDVAPMQPSQTVNSSLLMLQESVDLSPADRQQVKIGQSMIDGLEKIRMGIVNQSFPRETLQNIVDNLRKRNDGASNPELEKILQEIETRAEVELAKLQYAAKKREG